MASATLKSRSGRAWRFLVLGVVFAVSALGVEGERSAAALSNYWQAQKKHAAQPQEETAAWEFGRACFDLADFATNSTERASIAEQGISVLRELLGTRTNCAPAWYYLGLNVGQLARTKGMSALKLVDQMEQELLQARELDAHLDHGGPDRALGLLYNDAPAFLSVGSRTKARKHMQLAIELAPLYPDNRLNLLEAELKWGDRNGARRELKDLDGIWAKAKKEFSGPAWTASWAEWQGRLDEARKTLEKAARALDAPRHKQ
jgi:tetratricopeptide (TPR) repeat protein